MKQTVETNQTPQQFNAGGVLAISACHFVHDVYASFLAPLLPLLIEKLSMSLTQAGSLTAVMQLPSLLNPLIGNLADRFSVRWFVVLAPVMTALPMSLIGVAPNYAVLVILLLITGLSTAVFHVPAPVLISRLSGGRVGMGMSFYMTGGELARTVGPLTAVGAVSLLGLEHFYPIMVFGVAASVWLYLRLRNLPDITREKAARTTLGQTWREVRGVLLPLIAILVGRAFMHASMSTFLPTFIKQETGNLWLAGVGLTVLEAFGVVGALTAGMTSDRLGRRRVLMVSLLGAPLGMTMFVFGGGWLRFVALMITGLTLLSTTPVMLAVVQENAKSSPAGANGLFMMFSFLARSLTVIPVGILGDMMGLRTAYLISAGLGLLTLPFIMMLPKDRTSGE